MIFQLQNQQQMIQSQQLMNVNGNQGQFQSQMGQPGMINMSINPQGQFTDHQGNYQNGGVSQQMIEHQQLL